MTTLWELSEEIKGLERSIEDILESDELSEEEKNEKSQYLFDQWINLGESFQDKAEKVALFIKHEEAMQEAREHEAKRIQELAKQSKYRVSRFKKYLTNEMIRTNNTKVEGTSIKMSLRKKPPKLNINIDFNELPKEFVEVEYKPKKMELKSYIKAGNTLEGVSLDSNEDDYSLILK